MKVVLISKAMVVNATHSKANLLGNLLDLTLITPEIWPYYTVEKDNVPKNFRHVKLKTVLTGKNHFHFYLGLEKVLRDLNPDLVHIDEEPYSWVTFQVLHITKKLKIKALCFTWQNIYKKYPFPISTYENYVYRNIDFIITGNKEANAVLRQKGYKKGMTSIPQFGVDQYIFYPRDKKTTESNTPKPLKLGFVGRIIEEKGILTVLKAIKNIPEVHFYLAGTGNYKPILEDYIQENFMEQKVTFMGAFSSTAIAEKISGFDVLILPSLTKPNWKEQFGRILIEAMASKVAVIGSDSGEIPFVIGDAGLIFKEGDALACAESIKKVLNFKELARYQEAGYNRVISNFTQEIIVKNTINVYRTVINI